MRKEFDMLGFFEQTIFSFVSFVSFRTIESWLAVPRSRQSDQTESVKSRLSPTISALLEKSRVRVVRVSCQRNKTIAETRFVFPRTNVFFDYDENDVSRSFEDFIIAHELAHVRGNHPVLKMLIECAFVALSTSIAIELTFGMKSFLAAAAIALPIILAGVLGSFAIQFFLAYVQERDADRFATSFVGFASAFTELNALKRLFPTRRGIQNDLDARMRSLRSRQLKVSTE